MQNRHLLRQDLVLSLSPIRTAFEDFMLSRQAMRCTPATLEHYRYSAGAFLAWLERRGLGHPDEVQPSHVRNWLAEMARSGAKDTTLHAKPRGARTMLRFWVREGYSPKPVNFNMPRLATKRLPLLDTDEFKQVLNAATNPRETALLLVFADSGIRRAEAAALNWGDIDFATGAIVIRSGKGQKARTVAVGSHTRRALLACRRTLSQAPSPADPVWQTSDGSRLTARGLRSALLRIGTRTGVKVTPHMLRRSFALFSLQEGMDLVTLQRLLGHADVSMTGHYLQLLDRDLLASHGKHGLDNWL